MAVTPDTLYVIKVINLISGENMVYPEVFVNEETARNLDLEEVYGVPVVGFVLDLEVNFE